MIDSTRFDDPKVDPSLRVRCAPLRDFIPPQVVDGKETTASEEDTALLGELFTYTTQLQLDYNLCAIRMDCLIQASDDEATKDKKKTCPELDKATKE